MINKHIIYLGLNDKDTKQQRHSTVEAYKTVEDLIAKTFNGGTISESHGVYKHDDGQTVIEKTLRIEILFSNDIEIKKFAKHIKEIFNQESVAVEYQKIESELI